MKRTGEETFTSTSGVGDWQAVCADSNRVALFLPNLDGGGAERMMVNLARGLVDRDVDVDLVLANATGPYLDEVPSRVNLVDLGSRRVMSSFFPLMRYLRDRSPQAMLVTLDHASVVAILASLVARTSTRVFVREANVMGRSPKRGFKAVLMPFLMRLTFPRAAGIVAVAPGVAKSVQTHTGVPESRISTIANPVVTPEILDRAEEPADHPWFGEDQRPVVLAAGRLTEQKDFPTLIRAFERLSVVRDARLLILGEGEDRLALESLVSELKLESNVQLVGFVSNPFKFMSRASVFVLSSRWEGLPGVLVQAMACGCPVVSTDCEGGGPRDILDGGRFGPLVPVADVDALSDAIERVLEKPISKETLQARAADFSIDDAATKYIALMLER